MKKAQIVGKASEDLKFVIKAASIDHLGIVNYPINSARIKQPNQQIMTVTDY